MKLRRNALTLRLTKAEQEEVSRILGQRGLPLKSFAKYALMAAAKVVEQEHPLTSLPIPLSEETTNG